MVPQTAPARQPSRNGSAAVDLRHPVVDLVRRHRRAAPRARRVGRGPSRPWKATRTGSRPSPARRPVPVSTSSAIRAAEHLVAAADAQHRPPRRGPLDAARRPARARAATPGRRPWPGCRAARRGRRRRPRPAVGRRRTSTPGSTASASTSVTLRHPRQPDHRHPQRVAAAGGRSAARPAIARASSASSHRSRQPRAARRATGTPVSRVELVQPGAEQRRVAAELVDHERRRPAPGRPASSSASVPYSAANTPPRSMSPTTTTGSPARRARPMLT